MKAVICDIDGTLADCRHRLHHVLPGGKRNWDAFFAEMIHDDPIYPVVDVVQALRRHGYKIVLCSGRPENYREATEAWLEEHQIWHHALYMRAAGDTRPDHIVKAQILRGIREDGYEPFVVIDDRQSVVDMWRDSGLVCLQAAPSDPPRAATALLTVLVGPSGAGKSRWCAGKPGVVSSDAIRADLCGDFRDQSRNIEVFAAVHALAATRLKHNLPTTIDATNLRRKDRMTCAALAHGGPIEYVVLDRPMALKKAQAGWRADVEIKGVPLIEAHAQTFKSQIKEILRGDGLENVTVRDLRQTDFYVQAIARTETNDNHQLAEAA